MTSRIELMDDRLAWQAIARVVRERWKLLAMAIVLGTAATAAIVARTPQLYEASTTLALSGTPAPAGTASASHVRGLIATPAALSGAAEAAGLDAAVVTGDAVFVDPMPNTAFVRLRVRHEDPAVAARVADALSRVAVERSRELREHGDDLHLGGDTGMNDARTALRDAEERLFDFRTRSRLELLRAEISGTAPRASAAAAARSQSVDRAVAAPAGRLDELYQLERDLARLQTEYEVARVKYVEAVRTAYRESNVGVRQVHTVDAAVAPGQPLPRDRARKLLLGAGISALIGIVLVFAIASMRPLPSSVAAAR